MVVGTAVVEQDNLHRLQIDPAGSTTPHGQLSGNGGHVVTAGVGVGVGVELPLMVGALTHV